MEDRKQILARLLREEDGQSLIEYSLIAGIVAVGTIVVMTQMKTQIVRMFNQIRTTMAGL